MTKVRPLGNNLLVRRAEAEEKTPGGLIVPDSAKKKPHRGMVVAAGPGVHTEHGYFIATECATGDVVLFPEGIGIEVQLDGEALVMFSEDAAIAVVEVA
jgi:chaperonin GroES